MRSRRRCRTPAATVVLVLIGFIVIGVLLAWRVDINKFSLHMMYRNRLVRAYLGASNPKRHAHPFTGFDPNDDLHLDELLPADGKLQRPCHIVNTALNLVHGDELAWQTRKAANFTFTPAFCGFELPAMAAPGGAKLAQQAMRGGFRRTAAYRPKTPAARRRRTRRQPGHGDGGLGRRRQSQHGLPLVAVAGVPDDLVQRPAGALVRQSDPPDSHAEAQRHAANAAPRTSPQSGPPAT